MTAPRLAVRLALRRAGEVMTVALLLGWFVWLRPVSLGGSATYILLRGDSMEPTYHTGELVLLRQAARYDVGDVVAYRVPGGDIGAGHLVIHRIVAIEPDGTFDLRGDNNPSIDPWHVRPADVVGGATASVPGVGSLLALVLRPAVTGALALAVLVAWALSSGWFDHGRSAVPAGGSRAEGRPRYAHAGVRPAPSGHDRRWWLRRPVRRPEARP